MPQQLNKLVENLRKNAFAPIDIASLVVFRIAFGLLSLWHIWPLLSRDWIRPFWLEPRLLFKYYGFSWVHPWPGNGLYIHCVVLGILAAFIALGFLYRISAALFFLGHAYIFLLDEGRYQNHDYLICLFSFLLIFVPAHRAFSVDARLNPKLRAQAVPTGRRSADRIFEHLDKEVILAGEIIIDECRIDATRGSQRRK